MKDLKKLTKEFFKKEWTDLHGNLNDIEGSKCPGVYALAYTKENLSGQKVRFKDIHYFGMSNSKKGVKGRLDQFKKAINVGEGHSAVKRVFEKMLKGERFDSRRRRKKFWVAMLTFPYNVVKGSRGPDDLQGMGKVAALEYFLIAHFLKRMKEEPELNKK
jgi:hypothetical protein